MTVHTVYNVTDFNNAIGAAVAGDRIEIATNTALSNLTISSKNFGAGITVTSASGYDAVLSAITVTGSSGITFEDLTISRTLGVGEQTFLNAGTFTNSSNITIDNCKVTSSLDDDYTNDCDGLEFTGGANITVTDTEFTQIRKGLIVVNADNVNVSNNVIHHLGGDALNFVNIRDSQIVGNLGHSWGQIGEFHRDFIQFWTDPTKDPTDTVEIRGNVLLSPDAAVQGIFIESDTEQSFYNLTITENLILTGAQQGIVLAPAQDSVISHNTIIGARGFSGAGLIRVTNEEDFPANISDNITITDNISNGVGLGAGVTNISQSGNVTIQFADPNTAMYAGDLFLDAIAAENVNDLRPVPGSAIDTGVGASEPYTTDPVAYIGHSLSSSPTAALKPTFTAVDFDGTTVGGTTYSWDFGDGVTGEGSSIAHRFATPGEHVVSLTTTTPGVGVETVTKTIVLPHPVLLDLRFDNDPAATNSSSADVTDASTYARTGLWKSGNPLVTDPNADAYATGSSGSGLAAEFNSQTAEIVFSNAPEFNSQRQLTIALDVNADTLDTDRLVWKTGVFGVEMQSSGKLKAYLWTAAGQHELTTANAVATDVWNSVVVVFDGNANVGAGTGSLTIYVNGVSQGVLTGIGTQLASNTNTLLIGGGVNSRFFDGAMDNVRLYGGAYSPSDVATLDAYLANAAPTDIALSGDGVFERATAGTVVGTLSTVDGGDTATYALAPGSSTLFALSGADIVVASGASLDYETATSHQVIVRATDSAGNVRQETVSVTVKDAIEFPSGGGTLSGTSGADLVFGGIGSDHYMAGAGADTFSGGGGGFDVVDYINSTSAVGVDLLTPGNGFGDGAGDVITDADRVWGTSYNDVLSGSNSVESLHGDTGADTLEGRGGNDLLFGGGGNDRIVGGAGADAMQGSSGDDTYVFNPGEAQGDSITGFTGNGASAGDMLLLVGYGAGAALSNVGDQWTVTWSGGSETFTLSGVTSLDPSDYLFT